MREYQREHIEEACAAMASALAKLVAAVGGQAATTTEAGSGASIMLSSPEEVPGAIAADPTAIAHGIDDFGERDTSGRRINVYLAGSRGCATLARTYGMRIMAALSLDKTPYVVKCGTTTGPLTERLRQIGKDQYGATVRTKKGIESESGFAAWIAHTITTSREPLDPAITLMPRAIAIDLPPALTRRAFDAALHQALKRRCLASIPAGAVPRRFVAYDLVEMRISAATELYALSPHDSADGDLLLDAIEAILLKARAKRS